MDAVVAYIEGPDVDGTRQWPVETIWSVLDNPRTVLPEIGIAPRSLLTSALRAQRTSIAASGTAQLYEHCATAVPCRGLTVSPSPLFVCCRQMLRSKSGSW